MRLPSTPAWAIAAGCLLLGAAPALSAQALSAQPLAAQPLAAPAFALMDGGKVAYETCGSGPKALVLLHDGILDSSAFDAAWPRLCARFKVVRYDRRGYGASPAATAPYDAVADLAAVMKAAGIDHATVLGSSSGGGIAVDFALAHPDVVDGLVLVGAAVNGFKPTDHFNNRTMRLAGLLSQGRLPEAVKDPYILTPGAEAQRAVVMADLTAHPGNFGAARMIQDGPEVMGRLGEIKVPTLIITGEVDMPDIHAHAGALEALIPGAKRIVMTGGGHFIYLERPDAFADVLGGFVETAGDRRP